MAIHANLPGENQRHNHNNNQANIQHIEVRHGFDKNPSFSNSINIHVSNDAVMLQFLYIRPGTTQALLLEEVVLSPQHAIRFQNALDSTIKHHFTKHLNEDREEKEKNN